MDWRIEEVGFEEDKIASHGNKFLVGNGYLGIRGTLQEYEKSEFPAINLAGIYDQVGDAWREPLNAPNGLFTYPSFEGKEYRLPKLMPSSHSVALDFRYGIYSRNTQWNEAGARLCIEAQRFASLSEKHLIVMKYTILSEKEGILKLTTGIDGEVWDINGPHYDAMLLTNHEDLIQAVGITHENKDRVCVCEVISTDFIYEEQIVREGRKHLRVLFFPAQAGKTYTLLKYISVYTSKDCADYELRSRQLVKSAREAGYEKLLLSHKREWDKKWKISELVIEGDDEAMLAINYSLYHLHCIAPRHSEQLSIAARGLSGQTYKGAVFWDTEMFMLDFFLFTEPEVAKTLLKYRIITLEGAKKKAMAYGYQGAFYAWESQEGGYDACSDYNVTDVFTGRPMRTYFKDKQIHISSAVVYGMMRYLEYTGKIDLLSEGGAEVILECACFYYDLLIQRVTLERYELHDVIGPDEYHERVNNNAYTNRMAKYTFESAIRVIQMINRLEAKTQEQLKQQYNLEDLLSRFREAATKLYIPQADPISGVIPQFDGYEQLEDVSLEILKGRLLHEKEYWGGAYGIASHTKIIKQADVVTMLNLFSKEYPLEILRKNWEYYEPRTEHGSSLSACMYAMLACKCNMQEKAYPLFMKSATADLSGGGKQWAGLIYIGGTHPASSGGAFMTAIEGFAGIHTREGELKVEPRLPSHWTKMQFKLFYQGELYQIEIKQDSVRISKLEKDES